MTNIFASTLFVFGLVLSNPLLLSMGLFAISGAITNWLAIHMLFEKVPGLYGSGVIPARFAEFKHSIRRLMMDEFFTDENITRFIKDNMEQQKNFSHIIETIDITPAFFTLVEVIKGSSFGGMLAMVGGEAALQPLKEPFMAKMKNTINDIIQSETFTQQLTSDEQLAAIKHNIAQIIDNRLEELTPELVKEIIQDMIKTHLGWLVVWGGVFGGVIGLITGLLSN